jgi:hypothetical protein
MVAQKVRSPSGSLSREEHWLELWVFVESHRIPANRSQIGAWSSGAVFINQRDA